MTTRELLVKRNKQIRENNKQINEFINSWSDEERIIKDAVKLNKGNRSLLLQFWARLYSIKEIKRQLEKLRTL